MDKEFISLDILENQIRLSNDETNKYLTKISLNLDIEERERVEAFWCLL